jgi:hypothetical protein
VRLIPWLNSANPTKKLAFRQKSEQRVESKSVEHCMRRFPEQKSAQAIEQEGDGPDREVPVSCITLNPDS